MVLATTLLFLLVCDPATDAFTGFIVISRLICGFLVVAEVTTGYLVVFLDATIALLLKFG